MGSLSSSDNFTWLEHWYLSQCDGSWEHGSAITIETLDNPGWRVKINLNGTRFAAMLNTEIKESYESDSDWMICRITEGVYDAAGGPLRLGAMIQTFRSWIENF